MCMGPNACTAQEYGKYILDIHVQCDSLSLTLHSIGHDEYHYWKGHLHVYNICIFKSADTASILSCMLCWFCIQ